MNLESVVRQHSSIDNVPKASSALLMIVGGLVAAGWMFDIVPLKSVSPNWVTMKMNTAVSFILSGAALWCLRDEQAGTRDHFAGRIFASIVAVVALLTLGEHLLDADFGIDQALMKQPSSASDPASPGRMSAATACSFLLVALSLLGLDSKNRHGHRPALACALLTGLIGLLSIAGYTYGVKSLYAFPPFSSMAVHTASLFVAASVGILCARPDKGPLGILTADGIGSIMARRLLPLAILLPFLIGWLRLQGERAGFYGPEFGLALFATGNVVVFTILIWLTAVSLNRADDARQRTDHTLRDSEHRFRALLEHSSDGISLIDENNRILYLSPSVAAVEGYTAEELIGRNGIENTHPDDLPLIQEVVRQLMENPGAPIPVLWRRRHKNGQWLWLEGVATNLLHDPAVQAIVTNYRDVTGRKQAEEALLRFRMAMESSLDGIFLIDFETFRYLDVNETGCRMLGYSRDELLTMRTMDINPNITEADQRRRFEEAKTLGADHVMIESQGRLMRRKDGVTFPIEVARRYLRIGENEIVVGVARDVTERKQAEKATALLSAIVESSDDAIIAMDLNGIITNWNTGAQRLYGYSANEMVGNSVLQLIPSDRQNEESEILARIRRGERVDHFETVRTAKNGRPIEVSVAVSAIKDSSGNVVGASKFARDITERRQMELAMRDSEERYRTMANSIPQLAWMARADGYIYWYNQRWYEYTGKTPEQMEGWGWQSVHDSAVLPQVVKNWTGAIASGQPFEMEFPLRGADGKFRTFLTRVQPLKDSTGQVMQWFGTNTDVEAMTEVREQIHHLNTVLEHRVAQRTAELHAKNKELETFTYSVSHDLKAPLRGIDGYSRLLLADYQDKLDEDGRAFLTNICRAANQMQQLIDDLLNYSKLERQAVSASRIDLRLVVEAILAERRHDLERVRLSVDIAPQAVRADPEGISMALRNLIDNALKFSSLRQPPVIDIRSRTENDRYIISVQDNGTGFDMKYHERIFQIFQRLHRAEDYSGTGIGLAIVHKAMERMNGRVWAQSEPDKGAIFYLDLPCDASPGPSDRTNNLS